MIEGMKLLIAELLFGSFMLLCLYGAIEHVFMVEYLKIYAYGIMSIITVALVFYYYTYWKFITMPYALKLVTRPTGEDKEGKVYLDQFRNYDKKSHIAYFYNRNAIKCEEYHYKLNEIVHYLGIHDKPVEVDIKPYRFKEVAMQFYALPLFIECHNPLSQLEKGKIFYGYYKDGKYLVSLENQTHMITVGESGSGKSNFNVSLG